MEVLQPPAEIHAGLNDVVGYLNYSSGSPQPAFFRQLNSVWTWLASQGAEEPWRRLREVLSRHLDAVQGTASAFRDVEQARAVLRLVWNELLPAYRRFHADLLFHQSEAGLFQPFFVGRACEAVLAEGPPWNEVQRVVQGALRRLNSFVGHRPVPQLHGRAPGAPYEHEWSCPLPIYIRDAGTAAGPYQAVTDHALAILRGTPQSLLHEAGLDLDRLEELAVDLRAYDFEHPADKRPNYQFGQWDPHSISKEGYYQRLVVRQLALELLLERVREAPPALHDEYLYEAGAVLAGTMLMASGVDGPGPGAHDSQTTLATLIPRIASYRDRFYEHLLEAVPGHHGARLRTEARRLHQPFGGARQNFNYRLSRVRALQVQYVHVALLFARMGYPEAAHRRAQQVLTASARFQCEIRCLMKAAYRALNRRELVEAARLAAQSEEWLRRGIECGALADPWTILGFQAHYSLFPAVENSMYDHRVDVLLELMDGLFALRGRLVREAAAIGAAAIQAQQEAELDRLARWWDQFATTEVSGLMHVGGREAAASARQVARALTSWRDAGAASGAIGFWRQQVDVFDSPKAYAQVVEALLDKGDTLAAQALLMQWLSQRQDVPLARRGFSFHALALRWMRSVLQPLLDHGGGAQLGMPAGRIPDAPAHTAQGVPPESHARGFDADAPGMPHDPQATADAPPPAAQSPKTTAAQPAESSAAAKGAGPPPLAQEVWQRCARFMDFIEANAEDYWIPTEDVLGWGVPRPSGESAALREAHDDAEEDEDDQSDDVVAAAYEGMVYRDTTDDGTDAPLMDEEAVFPDAMEGGHSPLRDYLALMATMSQLWKLAARAALAAGQTQGNPRLLAWYRQAQTNLNALQNVANAIESGRLPAPGISSESLMEYDRHRHLREWRLWQIIMVQVETAEAARLLLALHGTPAVATSSPPLAEDSASHPTGSPPAPGESRPAQGNAGQARGQREPAGQAHHRNVGPGQAGGRQEATGQAGGTADAAGQAEPRDRHSGEQWPLWAQGIAALLAGNVLWFKDHWDALLAELDDTQVLYVAISRGGRATDVFRSQNVLRGMLTLLRGLPRLGLLRETTELLLVARSMERHRPAGNAAVSEFNRLFDAGFQAIVEALLAAASTPEGRSLPEAEVVEGIQQVMHDLATLWQVHSRSMWLSAIEHALEPESWKGLRQFIEEYGADLFTPKLMQHANLRAILQMGVDRWLRRLEEEDDGEWECRLLHALDRQIPREKAAEHLRLIFESVVDNYEEYRDYKSTTTQSDRGELLYMFLDYLRLKARYERIAWNLRPAALAHQVLCRNGRAEAAEIWRRLVAQHSREMADRFVAQLDALSQKYGFWLPTVADHIGERFVRPFLVDRVRMLVRPAMEQASSNGPHPAFAALEAELNDLAEQPTGSGLDVPEWLESLEDEADRPTQGGDEDTGLVDLLEHVPFRRLTWEEVRQQLAAFRPEM
jgi:hypothetical protein